MSLFFYVYFSDPWNLQSKKQKQKQIENDIIIGRNFKCSLEVTWTFFAKNSKKSLQLGLLWINSSFQLSDMTNHFFSRHNVKEIQQMEKGTKEVLPRFSILQKKYSIVFNCTKNLAVFLSKEKLPLNLYKRNLIIELKIYLKLNYCRHF